MSSTTGGSLYLTALETLERIEIQYVPKQLSMNRIANVAELMVIGRNNPLYHFSSGSKTLSLELDFHAEEQNREDVVRKTRWLEALAASDGFAGGQEKVRLTFGRLFKDNEVWTLKNCVVNLELFDPANGWLPRQAYVMLELALDPDHNLSQKDIKWGEPRYRPKFI